MRASPFPKPGPAFQDGPEAGERCSRAAAAGAATGAPAIGVRRAYDPPGPADGWRVLVDRVWPRGLARERLRLDDWMRELAPSGELRRWFGHDPARWDAFRMRYFVELDAWPEEVERLRERCRQGPVTLVFGARDQEHNNAVALRDYLIRRGRGREEAE